MREERNTREREKDVSSSTSHDEEGEQPVEAQASVIEESIPFTVPIVQANPWAAQRPLSEAFRDYLSESTFLGSNAVAASSSDRVQRLADLFRPPFDLLYRGTIDEARSLANIQKRWLMVNLQDPSEFSCQALNRDVWRDTSVKGIIKDAFVFMQLGHDTPQGKRYSNYYPVDKYPHIAVLDPRTGERIKVFTIGSTLLAPQDFLQEGTLFPHDVH